MPSGLDQLPAIHFSITLVSGETGLKAQRRGNVLVDIAYGGGHRPGPSCPLCSGHSSWTVHRVLKAAGGLCPLPLARRAAQKGTGSPGFAPSRRSGHRLPLDRAPWARAPRPARAGRRRGLPRAPARSRGRRAGARVRAARPRRFGSGCGIPHLFGERTNFDSDWLHTWPVNHDASLTRWRSGHTPQVSVLTSGQSARHSYASLTIGR
jgi:hypothetical protein